jgi:CRISPR system Cascade subunit CasB
VGRFAAALCSEGVSNGERATLKRWAPGQPIPLPFYRLWLRFVSDELPSEETAPAWVLVAWGICLMGARGNRPERPFGRAMAEAGITYARLERLLDAPPDVLPDLLTAVVRRLAADAAGFDWSEAAELLLARKPAARESIRRRIAVAFYRFQPKE